MTNTEENRHIERERGRDRERVAFFSVGFTVDNE